MLVLALVFQGTPTMVGPFVCEGVGDAPASYLNNARTNDRVWSPTLTSRAPTLGRITTHGLSITLASRYREWMV